MREVWTLSEADAKLRDRFVRQTGVEREPLYRCLSRVLAADVVAAESVPAFLRTSVDGYAVHACDTFGATESIPALLALVGEVRMGERTGTALGAGQCAYVPTGGMLPERADAMVMIEDATVLADGVVAVERPCAPGAHLVFPGDDARAGQVVLHAGQRLLPKDIGALAALGMADVPVRMRPRVAVLSTGDELVDASATPVGAQMRDVNGPMLRAQCEQAGAEISFERRVGDDAELLGKALSEAVSIADVVLLSGGSSVGVRDLTADLVKSMGTLLFHGLAVKPGKPTLGGQIGGVPVIGLPGHPVAAHHICRLLVQPMLARMLGTTTDAWTQRAVLQASIPSNHGREEYVPVRLDNGRAIPVAGKSGLITTLAQTDGYVRIPRDVEGCEAGMEVTVTRWQAW